MLAVSTQGETVDMICHRMLGKTSGATEAVLSMNPGLARLGPILPSGTQVMLPDQAEPDPVANETVKLWD